MQWADTLVTSVASAFDQLPIGWGYTGSRQEISPISGLRAGPVRTPLHRGQGAQAARPSLDHRDIVLRMGWFFQDFSGCERKGRGLVIFNYFESLPIFLQPLSASQGSYHTLLMPR